MVYRVIRGISQNIPRASPEGCFADIGKYYKFFIYPSGLFYVHYSCGISKVINEAYLGWEADGSSKKISHAH